MNSILFFGSEDENVYSQNSITCDIGTNLRITLERNKLLTRYLNHVIEHWKCFLMISKTQIQRNPPKDPFSQVRSHIVGTLKRTPGGPLPKSALEMKEDATEYHGNSS